MNFIIDFFDSEKHNIICINVDKLRERHYKFCTIIDKIISIEIIAEILI